MATTVRKPTLTEQSMLPKKRAKSADIIPLTDYFGVRQRGERWFNRASYDGYAQDNQLSLYDKFKLETLAKKPASELQDIIAKNGTVSACMDAYTSICSTDLSIMPGRDEGVMLWDPLLESAKFKRSLSQIFEMVFRRGGAVVELLFEKAMGKFIPKELRVHDPKRFDFQEVKDGKGDKWALGLSSRDYFGDVHKPIDAPNIEYIAWRPKAGEKPFGRSRLSASTYYAAVLTQTIRLVTKILSKSGSPVLPITIDKQKLFGGNQMMEQLFPGDDIDAYVRQQAAEMRKVVPALGEGDALILTGEMILGDYLTPASELNMSFLNDWSQQLRLDICYSLNVPPVSIGIVQKSGALNDHDSKVLIRDFKNNGHNDQLLVADHLQPIFAYGLRINDIRKRQPVEVSFAFNNPEERELLLDIQVKRATAMKDTSNWITDLRLKGVITEERAQELFETEYEALEMRGM